jgi:hypothetical protein
MANVDRPHGFKPIGTLSGSELKTRQYNVKSTNAKISINDPVIFDTTGTIDKAATSATQIVGISAQSIAASTGGTCLVYDDPNLLVEAQTDNGTGTCTAAADLFGNVDFIDTASTTDLSIMELDESSQTTTATLPFKVIALYPVLDNAHGEFNRLVCTINNHVYKSTGTTGLT